jgi:hypothetical protein
LKSVAEHIASGELGIVRLRIGMTFGGMRNLGRYLLSVDTIGRHRIEQRVLQKAPCKIIFLQQGFNPRQNLRGAVTHRPQVSRSLTRVETQRSYENLLGNFFQVFHKASSNQPRRVDEIGAISGLFELESGNPRRRLI